MTRLSRLCSRCRPPIAAAACSRTSRADCGCPCTARPMIEAHTTPTHRNHCLLFTTPPAPIANQPSLGWEHRRRQRPVVRSPLQNEFAVDRLADGKAVLANRHESVAAVEALRAEVLGPDADVERRIVRLEPLQSGLEQASA